MTSLFDELFSAENLSQNWQRHVVPDYNDAPLMRNRVIHNQYQLLQQLLIEKYIDISCLAVNFDELTTVINRVYPLDGSSLVVDANEKEYIVGLLEQLEALTWAMSLSTGKP